MGVNIRYTRAELLALAQKQHEYNLTAGALQKFKVIEAESIAPETSPPESHRNDAGGRKGEGKNGAGSRRAPNTERFAPPARISRGNKDQEAFEEGYKYELERNAMKKQALQETMAKEKERSDAVASSKGETKQEVVAPVEKEEPKLNEDDEVERWMTSIAMSEEVTKKVTKSRFFSGNDSDNKGAVASPLSGGQAFKETSAFSMTTTSKDPWALQGVIPTTTGNAVWGNLETQRNSGIALAPVTNSAAAPSVVVGQVQLPGHSGVSAPSSAQMAASGALPTSAAPAPAPAPAAAAALLATGPSSGSQKTTMTTAAAPLPNNPSANPSTQVWNAQDLEQMLLSGQKLNKQQKPEAARPKIIDAAALESQLLLQVQKNMARSQPQTQANVQQQQQQQPQQPPPASQIASMTGTPPTIPPSGQRRAPQLFLPQSPPQLSSQQPVPIHWGATMQKAPPQQMHQKLMQPQPQPQPQPQHRHPSMPQPVPFIISGAQGSPYFPQQAVHGHYVTGFMPGQGQQPMMVYRTPDGTTQYAVGSTGYPPSAQLLFSQPQQQQQQQPQQQQQQQQPQRR
ncbi:hypothetical protein ECC02_001293 [Trypanosoma cruzi]|uniref:4E-interacting protein n=1 Tax=Trypanosoma cruzi TaxID=5693 RepID=A0A7J6YFY4_TRYCR|nr:hypothetical protein ECC02_001293 [Trypanosoma cruzi]